MTKMTYSEQLKHPNWQRRRLEVMRAASFSCESCGDTETTLNVHHKRYVKGRMVWDYGDDELQCLCQQCHESEHAARDILDRVLAAFDEPNQPRALLAAYALSSGAAELSEEESASLWVHDPLAWRIGQAAALLSIASPAAQHAVIALLSGVVLSESPDEYQGWKRLSGLAHKQPPVISSARAAAEGAFAAWVQERKAEDQARAGGFE